MDIWPMVRSERQALAGDLSGLSDEQWTTQSLASEWTVRDALAHMTATAKTTPGNFFPKLFGAGLSFARMQAADIDRERGSTPADTLDRFVEIIPSTKRPPGPPLTMVGETIVHGEDIRRPLHIQHTYPMEWVVQAADFFKNSNLIIGTKRRIAGTSLAATDTAWSHGAGPEVQGPMLSLLLAMTGRKAALADLQGPGVEVLRSR